MVPRPLLKQYSPLAAVLSIATAGFARRILASSSPTVGWSPARRRPVRKEMWTATIVRITRCMRIAPYDVLMVCQLYFAIYCRGEQVKRPDDAARGAKRKSIPEIPRLARNDKGKRGNAGSTLERMILVS